MLIYLIPITTYIILVALILFILIKHKGRSKHIAEIIFHSLTLMIFYPIFMLLESIKRRKYDRVTRNELALFAKKQLKFHLVFGGFLFYYRNKNFKDDDLDIAVFRKDFNDEFSKILIECGYFKIEEWSLDGKVMEQHWVKENFSMDVFVIDSKNYFAPTFDEKNSRYGRRPTNLAYDVTEYEIDGIKFMAPSNPVEYLSWNYGDWQKPDPNYHWLYGATSTPNTIIESKSIGYKKYKKT